MTRRAQIGIAVGVALIAFTFPFNATVAPDWTVQVVDEDGKPAAGVLVQRGAVEWTLGGQSMDSACTSVDGTVHFDRRTMRVPVGERLYLTGRDVLREWPHGSHGPWVKVWAEGLGYGDIDQHPSTVSWNGIRNRMTSRLVLRRCPPGRTGYHCGFDYDYFFRVNSSAGEMRACRFAP
jgi:hypothetical protein